MTITAAGAHFTQEKMMTDLFDPFDCAGLNLPNRMIMAPMTRTRDDDAGVPTDAMRVAIARSHSRRSY
ncbi:MAG: hypothetical protein NVSMB28_04610 [Collimonas sp.]